MFLVGHMLSNVTHTEEIGKMILGMINELLIQSSNAMGKSTRIWKHLCKCLEIIQNVWE